MNPPGRQVHLLLSPYSYNIWLLLLLLLNTFILPQNRWEKLNGPLGGGVISLLAKGDTLVASMGEKSKIYYSTNEGALWFETPEKFPDTVIDMVLANDGAVIAGVHYHGIFRSYDLINWENIYSYINDDIWSVGKDQYGYLYAGTEQGKIIISTNNGSTWSVDFLGTYRIKNYELFRDSILLAGGSRKVYRKEGGIWNIKYIDSLYSRSYRVFSGGMMNVFAHSGGTLFLSEDGGNTWIKQDTSGFLNTTDIYFMTYNSRLIAGCSPNEFQPGWGIALSDDDGQTWRYTHSGLPPKFIAAGPFLNVEQFTYAGTWSAGIFKSTDFGENWTAVNDVLTAATTSQVCFDHEGTIYTANWSNGFQRSTDGGETWKVINNGLTNSLCLSIIADDDGNIIGGTQEGIFRSTDKGENWIETATAGNDICYHLIKDEQNRIYAVISGSGLYRTTDLGYTWLKIDQGFAGSVFGIYIDNHNNIYAGTYGGRIYRSTNDELTWTLLYNSPRQGSTIGGIVVTNDGYIFASNNYEGILRSTDNGVNWEIVRVDTNYQPRSVIAANKKGVYASVSGAMLYFSSDKGESWVDVTGNLEYNSLLGMMVNDQDRLYFATYESVWRESIFSTTEINEEIKISSYSLNQNYPNPFNPSTKISYSLKEEGEVKLLIYDIKGELISTLINGRQQSGSYEVDYTLPGSISTGVYIYRLTVTDNNSHNVIFSDVKKMVYLK